MIEISRAAEYLRIKRDRLARLQDAGRRTFDAPDLATILWQAGLLGTVSESGQVTFFSMDKLGRMRIPRDVLEYAFHPSMREVAGLKPLGATINWLA